MVEMRREDGVTICTVVYQAGKSTFLWVFEPSRKWKVRSEVALFALCKSLDFTWSDACEVYGLIDLAINAAGES